MLDIVISFLTFVLILVSLFLVLVILMQRGSSSGGMGAAFGGGVAESAFGAETTNILTKATKWAAFAFFIIALALYLMYMSKTADSAVSVEALPEMAVAAEAVDTTTEAEQSAVVEPAESAPVGEPSQSESAPETPAEPGN
jgi:preprotein translocase subunit SecG